MCVKPAIFDKKGQIGAKSLLNEWGSSFSNPFFFVQKGGILAQKWGKRGLFVSLSNLKNLQKIIFRLIC